jgi:hypothetical protein
MSDLKKRSTLVNEVARRRLNISRDEYALNQYIHYRCADPRQKVSGWCCDTKEEIAEFVGVTRPGLYQMIRRMQGIGLVEVGVFGAFRCTEKFIDIENDCKQSLQPTVNKVYTDCKQSLQPTVNKVYTQYKVKEDISKSKEEEEEKAASLCSSTFEAEKEKRIEVDFPAPQTAAVRLYDPQLPGVTILEPAPMPQYQADPRSNAPAPIERVSIPDEIEALKTDAAAKEAFTLSRKIPSSRFEEYVEAFRIDIAGRGETYPNVRKFRAHFFNWAGIRWEIQSRKRVEDQKTKTVYEKPKTAVY